MKYDAKIRPTLDPKSPLGPLCPETIGTDCPCCRHSLLAMHIDDFVEHADGSATGRCGRCKAPLRQNPEGFIFLENV